ncbi:hypothetical protein TNCV_3420711 [Trichonephila clavipes]|nr:hypothetical protein TNCV_3420711 [Trichonephila clavipes]
MSDEKVHLRHCVLFEFHEGNSTTEAKTNLCDVFGEEAVTARTCQRRPLKFRLVDFSLKNKQDLENHQMSVSATQDDQDKSHVNFHRSGLKNLEFIRLLFWIILKGLANSLFGCSPN